MVGDLQQQHQAEIRSTTGVLVHANQAPGPCPSCGGVMHVRKTVEHGGVTLEHGGFQVRETVHVCAAGCRTPGPEGRPGRAPSHARPRSPSCWCPGAPSATTS